MELRTAFSAKGSVHPFRKKDCLDAGCCRTSKDRPHIAGVLHRIQQHVVSLKRVHQFFNVSFFS